MLSASSFLRVTAIWLNYAGRTTSGTRPSLEQLQVLRGEAYPVIAFRSEVRARRWSDAQKWRRPLSTAQSDLLYSAG